MKSKKLLVYRSLFRDPDSPDVPSGNLAVANRKQKGQNLGLKTQTETLMEKPSLESITSENVKKLNQTHG